jgi:hypothetical protein
VHPGTQLNPALASPNRSSDRRRRFLACAPNCPASCMAVYAGRRQGTANPTHRTGPLADFAVFRPRYLVFVAARAPSRAPVVRAFPVASQADANLSATG